MMPRTLLKTCTYCVMHFTVAIIVAYALTRSWQVALAVGIVEPLVQTGTFAIHERVWSKAPERINLPIFAKLKAAWRRNTAGGRTLSGA